MIGVPKRIIPVTLLLATVGASAAGVTAAPAWAPSVHVASVHKFGKILVAPSGMTLYYFTVDKHDKSACFGQCAHLWPPLMLPAKMKAPSKPKGLPGTLGAIKRGKGRQLTYDGRPLYTYIKDKKSGQTTGQGVGNVWFVVKVK